MERKPVKQNPQYSRNALLIFPSNSCIHFIVATKTSSEQHINEYHHSWSNLLQSFRLLMQKLLVFLCVCIVVTVRSPVIRQKLPGYVREQGYCVPVPAGCLCSVVSTVSPLGRHLTKMPSFLKEAGDPGASVRAYSYCTITGHAASLLCIHAL